MVLPKPLALFCRGGVGLYSQSGIITSVKRAQTTPAYPAIFTPADEGGFVVTFSDFPGCVTEGDTFEEAHTNVTEVLGLWIEELQASHKPIPTKTKRPIIGDIEVAAGIT